MGFFDFMTGEDRGMNCEASIGQDGTVHGKCKRVVKDKRSGEMTEDGQSVEFSVNPSNCSPMIESGTVLDKEKRKFDEEIMRFSSGCRRESPKKGLTRG